MVKTDFDHDYYADLELPSDAGIEEIKKQFRKLGELVRIASGTVFNTYSSQIPSGPQSW